MIASIDHLTLVVAGAVLFGAAGRFDDKGDKLAAWPLFIGGLFVFLLGLTRTLMQALGL